MPRWLKLLLILFFVSILGFSGYFFRLPIFPPKPETIILRSEVPGYNLKLLDESGLKTYLQTVNFWQKNWLLERGHPTVGLNPVTALRLVIS